MKQQVKLTPTPDCCEYWPKFWHVLNWMFPGGNPKEVCLMPFIALPDGTQLRVNHCPSCGRDVRDCVVDRDRLVNETFW